MLRRCRRSGKISVQQKVRARTVEAARRWRFSMLRKSLTTAAIFGLLLAVLGTGSLQAQNSSAQSAAPATAPAQTQGPRGTSVAANHKADIPAYHPEAPKGPLPETLDPRQFLDAET